jgi:hypothetical protein
MMGMVAVAARARRHYDCINLTADQISRHFRQAINIVLRPAKFDRHVAALEIAAFTQSFAKCGDKTGFTFRRAETKESDSRAQLLRAHRQRPRRCAAE